MSDMHDRIIDNLDQYEAKDLVKYIRQGVVTLDELQDEGLAKPIQDEIRDLLEVDVEDDDWQQACNEDTEEAYSRYLYNYPYGKYRSVAGDRLDDLKNAKCVLPPTDLENGETQWANLSKNDLKELENFVKQYPHSHHIREANKLINEIVSANDLSGEDHIRKSIELGGDIAGSIIKLIDSGTATIEDLANLIKEDHNILTNVALYKLMKEGCINDSQLAEAGIDEIFRRKLRSDSGEEISSLSEIQSPTLSFIPDGFNEIYFWGVPRSGKTCALGSIMSTITASIPNRSCKDSQGLDYMQQLASSFKMENEVSVLPPATFVDQTHEMRYILIDSKGKSHGIAFIDIAGELFKCMGKRTEDLDEQQKSALKVLNDVLVANRSSNPKMHFFVVEYGGESKLFDGKSQAQHLANCVSYLEQYNIFEGNTIGVYMIITKADKAQKEGKDIGAYVDKYYAGFQEGLKNLMKDNGICTHKGKPELKRFPFSVGDVCFRWWCKYDPEWTLYIIDEILERSYGKTTGLTGRLLTNLRG